MRKKLPIGIQTFSNLIREGYCYGDKYRSQGEVWLIGVAFSSQDRNIVGFERKKLQP